MLDSILGCLLISLSGLALLGFIEITDILFFFRPTFLDLKEILLFICTLAGFYCITALLFAFGEGIIIFVTNSVSRRARSPSLSRKIKAIVYTLCFLPPVLHFSTRLFSGKGISTKLALIESTHDLPFNFERALSYTFAAGLIVIIYIALTLLITQNQLLLSGKMKKVKLYYFLAIITLSIFILFWANSRLYIRLYEYIHSLMALLLILLTQLLMYILIISRKASKATPFVSRRILGVVAALAFAGAVIFPDLISINQNVKLIFLNKTSIARKMAVHLDELIQRTGRHYEDTYSLLATPREKIFTNLDYVLASRQSAYPIARVFRKHHYLKNPETLNVLYIVIDAFRADHLGCYGYGRNTSPAIDKLAEEGILFLNNFAQGNHTFTSISSLFTSRYYYTLAGPDATDNTYSAFTTSLGRNNFTSYALYRADEEKLRLSNYFPVNQILFSFDHLSPPTHEDISRIFEKFSHEKRKRFFMYLHLPGCHYPHKTHPKYNFGWALKDRYDSEVRYWDSEVAKVIKSLDKYGLKDRTILIINADHGSELKEHGGLAHGSSFYNEQIRVPLIMRIPFVEPKAISPVTGNIDVIPTIFDLLNISPDMAMHGSSLVPLIQGRSRQPVTLFSESEHAKMILKGQWKFIFDFKTGCGELYNLTNDPKELFNLIDKKHSKALELKKDLAFHTLAEYQINRESGLLDKMRLIDRDSIIDHIVSLLHSEKRSSIITALDFIKDSEDRRFLEPLLEIIFKLKDEVLLAKAIPCLGNFKDPESIHALKQLLKYPDQNIKEQVLRTLINLKDPRLTDELKNFFRDNRESDIIRGVEFVSLAEYYKQGGNIAKAKEYCLKARELDAESPYLKKLSENLHAAQFVSQSVPDTMRAGETYEIRITMRNNGLSRWIPEGCFFLDSTLPKDNLDWDGNRVYLSANDFVAPGETKTFSMVDRAPLRPGKYNFQRMMALETGEAFGTATPKVTISVISPALEK